LARFNLIVPLYQDKFFSGLEVQYNGAVKSISGRGINDFWLVNLTLFSQKIVKNLEASVSVYNLFDQKYYFTGASEHLLNGMDRIQQDGISWWLKLNYHF
jgi:outer membrane receptor protein involved in Fe transport